MTSIELLAPAKVNLFLKVLSKRKDSYHDILTIFERVSLSDKIKISKIPNGIKITSDVFITRSPKANLAYKAAEAILKYKKIKSGVKIDIKKRIPIAAGLGGGSSDAAAVLTGINGLLALNLNNKALLRIGRKIGADVPFFILNKPFAIGMGKGDRLKVLDSKTHFWHLIIYPGFGISTKEVYEALDAEPLSNPSTGSGFDPEFIEGSKHLTRAKGNAKIPFPLADLSDFDATESMLHNDLEGAAISKSGSIGKIIKCLAYSLGKKTIVSGSGPSLFCLYRTRKEATRGKKRFLSSVPARERKGWRAFIAKTEV